MFEYEGGAGCSPLDGGPAEADAPELLDPWDLWDPEVEPPPF